jgi:hypothetical protein
MDVMLTCSRDCKHYYSVSNNAGTCAYHWQNMPVIPHSICKFNLTIDSLDRVTTEEERSRGRVRARGGPVDGQAGEAD